MRACFEKIPLGPSESFACREFRVPRFEVPWHFHPEYELSFIMRGGGGMRYVGDSIERFAAGDFVLLGPNLPHYWWSDADVRGGAHSVVIQFGETFAGRGLWEIPEAAEVARLLSRARRGLAFSGRGAVRVAAELRRMPETQGWERLRLLLEILGRLAPLPAKRLASAGFAPDLDEHDGRRLEAVCQYVNENYAEDIHHATAASLAGLSPGAFSRYFHRRMGKPFESYVAEVRIGHACRHLIDEDMTIAEAAFACGFNNLSNFNRRFRALKGITPREFRKLRATHAASAARR